MQCDIRPLVRSGYNVRVTLIEAIVGSNTRDGSILMNNATHPKVRLQKTWSGVEWRLYLERVTLDGYNKKTDISSVHTNPDITGFL